MAAILTPDAHAGAKGNKNTGSTTSSTTFYVSTSGNDANAGTMERPWRTLRKGLTSLRSGQTLVVRGGTYAEILGAGTPIQIAQGTATSRILVRAYQGERPVLRGLLWLQRPSYWTIEGLDVTWQDGQDSRSHMVRLMNGVGWEFRKARVWGARSYAGILVASTISQEPSNWRISGCTVHDTYASNSTNQDHLIYVNTGLSGGPGVIEGNILFNALNGCGIKLGGANSSQGTARVTVSYNTIHNARQSVLVSWLSTQNTISRNIFSAVGTNYGYVRGFQLEGVGNAAQDNLAPQARHFILNDAGYVGVADGGGNLMPVDPMYDFVGVGGFRPTNPAAQAYGAYALNNKHP
jgi:hypothetical protein